MNRDSPGPGVCAGVFCLSAAALLFELSLARFFSIALFHHFGFLVISLAFLGVGAGGLGLLILPGLASVEPRRLLCTLAVCFALTSGLSVWAANSISFDAALVSPGASDLLKVLGLYAAIFVPFAFFGLAVAAALERFRDAVSRIYFSNLLGSGLGCLLPLAVYQRHGFGAAIWAVLFLALAAAAFFAGRDRKPLAAVLVAAFGVCCLLLLPPAAFQIRLSAHKSLAQAVMSGGSITSTGWNYYSRVDAVESPLARFAPGLSLKFEGELPRQTGFTVDGDDLGAISRFSDLRKEAEFVSFLPAFAPYALGPAGKVLIIEPSGDADILAGLRAGARNILCLEMNGLVARLLKSSDAGRQPGVRVVNAEARGFLRATGEKFNLIVFTLARTMGASAIGNRGLAESRLLTREAAADYFRHLEETGLASFTLYLLPPPRAELRLLATLLEAWEAGSGGEAGGNFFVFRSLTTMTILAKKTPFTPAELGRLRQFCRDLAFDPVYYRGINPGEQNHYNRMSLPVYEETVARLFEPAGRRDFYSAYLFDVAPAVDDRPFFHDFYKLSRIFDTYRSMRGKWRFLVESRFLAVLALAQAVLAGALFLVLPVALARRNACAGAVTKHGVPQTAKCAGIVWDRRLAAMMAWFGLIGWNFMLLEIGFMQKFVLFLGNPFAAMSVAIFALLLWAAAGASMSGIPERPGRMATIALCVLVCCSACFVWLEAPLGALLAPLPPAGKVLSCVLLLAPVGLPMGCLFPAGIRLLGPSDGGLIPWAWCANGFASVLGSVAAMILAAEFGCDFLFWTAAAGYALAAAIGAAGFFRNGGPGATNDA